MGKAKTKSAKIRQKRGRREPGCMVLPEDNRSVGVTMHLKAAPRERSQRIERTEAAFVPQYRIEERLLTAMKTIRALPDTERRFFRMKGASLPYVQEYLDAYASAEVRSPMFVPKPEDVSDCLTALSWVRHVSKKSWKIMWLRSFGFSFGLIGKYIGRSDETARRWYREGITDAWAAANGV